jgi:hypothetical protein
MSPVREIAPHPDATIGEEPGGFRKHDIRPFSGGMRPPPWTDVGAQLTSWVDDVNRAGVAIATGQLQSQDIPLELARIHNGFEKIHPFLDGNGRTGRLVLNLVLVRLGFPPAIIFKRNRDAYIDALDQADKGDPGRLAEQIARSVIDNLHRLVVPNIAGPARIVPGRMASGVPAGTPCRNIGQAAIVAARSNSRGFDAKRSALAPWMVGEYRHSSRSPSRFCRASCGSCAEHRARDLNR